MTERMERLDICNHCYKGIKMVTKCKDCKYHNACDDFGY